LDLQQVKLIELGQHQFADNRKKSWEYFGLRLPWVEKKEKEKKKKRGKMQEKDHTIEEKL